MAEKIVYGNPVRETLEDTVSAVNELIDEGGGGSSEIEKVKFTLNNSDISLSRQQVNEINGILYNYYFVPNRTKEPYIAIEDCMISNVLDSGYINCNLYIQDGFVDAGFTGVYSPNHCYTLFKGVIATDEPIIINLYILLYEDNFEFYYTTVTPEIIG